jgi:hypothetical protein
MAELKQNAEREVEQGRRAVADGASETIERLKTLAAPRRPEAVKNVVAMLLGEEEVGP